MSTFNLTAQINLQGPKNTKQIANNIKKELGSITASVSLNATQASFNSLRKQIKEQSFKANVDLTIGKGSFNNIREKISKWKFSSDISFRADASSLKSLREKIKAQNLTANVNLNVTKASIKSLQSQLNQSGSLKLNAQLNLNKNAVGSLSAANKGLNKINGALTRVTANANKATKAVAQFVQTINGIASGNITVKISATSKALQDIGGNSKVAFKNLKSANSEMYEFGRQAAIAARRFIAFSAGTSIIRGLNQAVNDAVRDFIAFDRELNKIEQIAGFGAGNVSGLRSTITELSTTLGVSSSKLAETSVILKQAGLSVRDVEVALRALAKTDIAPTFTDLNQTVEGAVALMNQFDIGVNKLEASLSSINAVSAVFAVESSDIITAIQRAGGVFAAASQGVSTGTEALNEFIAVFTSVRSTTRESAETIATGLRTIFTRLQRQSSVDALSELGANLRDSEGNFIGAYRAIEELSSRLASLDTRSGEFAAIVEELGGFRQVGKLIPLITQFAKARKALKVANEGAESLTEAEKVAQKSLAIQFQKTKESFSAMIRELGSSTALQGLITTVLNLSSAIFKLIGAFKDLVPLIAVIGAAKLGSGLIGFTSGFASAIRSPSKRFATGGMVPGSGNTDSVNAMLTPGEFVINKRSASRIGYGNLQKMNKPKGYFMGGVVNRIGGAIQKYRDSKGLTGYQSSSGSTVNFGSGTVKALQDLERILASMNQPADQLAKVLTTQGKASKAAYQAAMVQAKQNVALARTQARSVEETKKAIAAEKAYATAKKAVITSRQQGVGGFVGRAMQGDFSSQMANAAMAAGLVTVGLESMNTELGSAGASFVSTLVGIGGVVTILMPIMTALGTSSFFASTGLQGLGVTLAPFIGIMAAVAAAVALTIAAFSAYNAYIKKSIELEKARASTRIDAANVQVENALEKFAKLVDDVNLRGANSAINEQMNAVGQYGRARGREVAYEQQGTSTWRELGAYLTLGYVDSIEDASENNQSRIQAAANDMVERYADAVKSSTKVVEGLFQSGYNIQDLQNAAAGTAQRKAFDQYIESRVLADRSYQEQAMTAQAEGRELPQQVKDAIRQRIINEELAADGALTMASKMQEAQREQTKLNLLQKRLTTSFENLQKAVDQSAERIQFEANARQKNIDRIIASASGQATIQDSQDRMSNVLDNPLAYSQQERDINRQNIERSLAPALGGALAKEVAALSSFNPSSITTAVQDAVTQQEELKAQEVAQKTQGVTDPAKLRTIERELEQKYGQGNMAKEIGKKLEIEIDNLENMGAGDTAENLRQQAAILEKTLADRLKDVSDPAQRQAIIDEEVGKFNDALAQSRDAAIELAKRISSVKVDALNKFIATLNKANDLYKEAQNYYQKARDTRRSANDSVNEALYGFGPTAAEIERRGIQDVASLTGISTNNPNALLAQRGALEQQAETQQKQIDDAMARGDTDQAAKLAENLRATNIQLDYNKMALEKLAENAEKAAEAMLAEVKERKRLQEANTSFAETLLTSGPDELKELDEALVRANQRVNGFIPQAGASQRKRFFELLKQTGSVSQASQTVAAETRAKDLKFLEQTKDVRMYRLQSEIMAQNPGMAPDEARRYADAVIRQQQAAIYNQMGREAGLGQLGQSIVGQAIATTADPMNDPVMRDAVGRYRGYKEQAARANEALGKVSEDAANKAVTAALYNLKESIDALNANIKNESIPQSGANPLRRASGGLVYASAGKYINFEPKGTDTIPAMLTPGEFVVNARATKQNRGLLEAINGGAKGYRSGGVVYLRTGGGSDDIQWEDPPPPTNRTSRRVYVAREDGQYTEWTVTSENGREIGASQSLGVSLSDDALPEGATISQNVSDFVPEGSFQPRYGEWYFPREGDGALIQPHPELGPYGIYQRTDGGSGTYREDGSMYRNPVGPLSEARAQYNAQQQNVVTAANTGTGAIPTGGNGMIPSQGVIPPPTRMDFVEDGSMPRLPAADYVEPPRSGSDTVVSSKPAPSAPPQDGGYDMDGFGSGTTVPSSVSNRSKPGQQKPEEQKPELWVDSDNWFYRGLGYAAGVGQAAGNVLYGAANVVGGAATAVASPVIGWAAGDYETDARRRHLDAQIAERNRRVSPDQQTSYEYSTNTYAGTGAAAMTGVEAMAQGAYTLVEAGQAVAGQGPVMRGERTWLERGDDQRVEIASRGGMGAATRFFQNVGFAASQAVPVLTGFGAPTGPGVLGTIARGASFIDDAPLLLATRGVFGAGGRMVGRGLDAIYGQGRGAISGPAGRALSATGEFISGAANMVGSRIANRFRSTAVYDAFLNMDNPDSLIRGFRDLPPEGIRALGNMIAESPVGRGVASAWRGASEIASSAAQGVSRGATRTAEKFNRMQNRAGEFVTNVRNQSPARRRALAREQAAQRSAMEAFNNTPSGPRGGRIGPHPDAGEIGIHSPTGLLVKLDPDGSWRFDPDMPGVPLTKRGKPSRKPVRGSDVLRGKNMLGPPVSGNILREGSSPTAAARTESAVRSSTTSATVSEPFKRSTPPIGSMQSQIDAIRRDSSLTIAQQNRKIRDLRRKTSRPSTSSQTTKTTTSTVAEAPPPIPSAPTRSIRELAEEQYGIQNLGVDSQGLLVRRTKNGRWSYVRGQGAGGFPGGEIRLLDPSATTTAARAAATGKKAAMKTSAKTKPRSSGLSRRAQRYARDMHPQLAQSLDDIVLSLPEANRVAAKNKLLEAMAETKLKYNQVPRVGRTENGNIVFGRFREDLNQIDVAQPGLARRTDVHELAHFVQSHFQRTMGSKLSNFTIDDLHKIIPPKELKQFMSSRDFKEIVRRMGTGYSTYRIIQKKPNELFTVLNQAFHTPGTSGIMSRSPAKDVLQRLWKAQGYNKGGVVYASNGALMPYAPKGTDTVPAMLTPGEFVINKEATSKYLPVLRAINNGYGTHNEMVNHLAKGGAVGTPKYLSTGGGVNNGVSNTSSRNSEGFEEMRTMMGDFNETISTAISNMNTSIGAYGEVLNSAASSLNTATSSIPDMVNVSQNVSVNGIPDTLNDFGSTLLNSSVSQSNEVTQNKFNEMNRRNEGSLGMSSPNNNQFIS